MLRFLSPWPKLITLLPFYRQIQIQMSTIPHERIRNTYLDIDPNLMIIKSGMNVVTEWYHVVETTHMVEPEISFTICGRHDQRIIRGFIGGGFNGSMIGALLLKFAEHPLL